MSSLNVLEQAKLTRQISSLLTRIQKCEGYFSGVEFSSAHIGTAQITNAKIADGSITTALIANATIENAKINDLNASKITTGTLNADRIGAGTITVTKLDTVTTITSLDAISANLGSVNAGTISGVTITGGTVKTAESGSRVEMVGSPERFTVWTGTDKRIELSSGVFVVYGSSAIKFKSGSTVKGYIDASSTSINIISPDTTNSGMIIRENNYGDIYIQADDVIDLIAPTVKLDPANNGTPKSAIVSLGDVYKAVYCAESPDVWFMDIQKELDPLFIEVIEGDIHKFQCTDGYTLFLSKRKGFIDKRFEQKTSIEYERNERKYANQ